MSSDADWRVAWIGDLVGLSDLRPLLPDAADRRSGPLAAARFAATSGEEEERIVLAALPDGLAIGPWFIEWQGHHPVETFAPLAVIPWNELEVAAPDVRRLSAAIDRARARRRRRYRRCSFCGSRVALEHTVSLDRGIVCSACAEQRFGVVF